MSNKNFVYPPKYVIAGPLDVLDNEQLYWSNEDGWVDRASATVFSEPEYNLPIDTSAIEAA